LQVAIKPDKTAEANCALNCAFCGTAVTALCRQQTISSVSECVFQIVVVVYAMESLAVCLYNIISVLNLYKNT